MNKAPAFFLDRDGTINIDHDYVHRKEEWDWCKGAIEAIKWMNDHGFKVIVVTNQSGISRGKYTVEQVNKLHDWVDAELAKHQAKIDAWYIAPYHPLFSEGGPWPAEDRKPETGMFTKAIASHNIDAAKSFMIGDKNTDLIPGVKLGMKPIFITSRHESEQDKNWLKRHKVPIFPNIGRALEAITAATSSPFQFS